jgi:hypothetical protein
MDTDELLAPPGWGWTIDDELAHHAWLLTANTPEVGWGPDPPLLMEALMGFFDGKDITDSINSWLLTRDPESVPDSHTDWKKIPTRFSTDLMDSTTARLMDEQKSVHPLRVKIHGQQYTTTGAMFTYDFTQWQAEEPSGFMRIPVADELLAELRERVEPMPFTETQYQSREYRSQFAAGQAPMGTFAHPHYSAEADATQGDYKELWTVAHDMMKRSARMEAP